MRRELGSVHTIYEGEEDDSSPSSSPSPSPSSPSSLHSAVQAWSLTRGRKPDVLIHVQSLCFRLHKEALSTRSGYLKRLLTEASEVTLCPPLNISPETFTVIANFCYGTDIILTPFNIAGLRTAAEQLEMTEPDRHGGESLRHITESYFCQALALNQEYASMIFRSCLPLLPEAEETASLASRCIEALCLMEDSDLVAEGLDDVATLPPETFQIIADSMQYRFDKSHDLLYEIVDFYLKEQQGKVTEEQIIQICNSIDCDKLSPQFLMHAVQNSRMPLRFVVRAMLMEQLNTRRSIFSGGGGGGGESNPRRRVPKNSEAVTLGAILQRDAALRQVAQLKEAMDATCSRIQNLEKDLGGMKRLLRESETRRTELESARSASFRVRSTNKVEVGERGSVSSVSHRFNAGMERVVLQSSRARADNASTNPRTQKKLGRRLLNGLKNAFRLPSSKRDNAKKKNAGSVNAVEDTVVVIDGEDDDDGGHEENRR